MKERKALGFNVAFLSIRRKQIGNYIVCAYLGQQNSILLMLQLKEFV